MTQHCTHRTRRHRRDRRRISARRRSPRPAVRAHTPRIDRGPARRPRSDRGTGSRAHRSRRARRSGGRGVPRRQGHPERAGRRLVGAAVRRAHGGVRAAERRRTGGTGGTVLPRRRRWCRPPCGSRRNCSQRAGCGCAPSRGWCCRTPTGDAATAVAELLRGAGHGELTDFAPPRGRSFGQRGVVMVRRTALGMFRRDDVAALAGAICECLAVARAEGANLGDEVIDEIVGMLARPAGHHHVDADRPEANGRWSGTSATASSCARPPPTGSPRRSATCWCRCSPRQATDPARHRALGCMAMNPCERVGLDFIDSAPFRFVSTVDLTITPSSCSRCSTTPSRGRSGRRRSPR